MKRLAQIFEDQAGNLDEKRILGVPILLSAVVFLWIHPGELGSFSALSALGVSLLGVSVLGDQGKLDRGA
jgi:hypothetical protein